MVNNNLKPRLTKFVSIILYDVYCVLPSVSFPYIRFVRKIQYVYPMKVLVSFTISRNEIIICKKDEKIDQNFFKIHF